MYTYYTVTCKISLEFDFSSSLLL